MRKFDYRVPRFTVDFPVRVTQGGLTQLGRCKEISSEGMKVVLREPFSPDSFCAAHFDCEDLSFKMPVRVIHSGADSGGLKFIFESDDQRDAVGRLMEFLATPKPCTSLALLR